MAEAKITRDVGGIPVRTGDNFCEGFVQDIRLFNSSRKEEEVQVADMEVRLRSTIIDVLKPTVHRATRLQTEYDVLVAKYDDMRRWVQEIADTIQESKKRADMVLVFQSQLEKFWDHYYDLEGRVSVSEKTSQSRFDVMERDLDLQKQMAQRLSRSLDRSLQDMAKFHKDMKDIQFQTESTITKSREQMQDEVKRIDHDIGQFRDTYKSFVEEVWGPEDCAEIAPPSLRRFDLQLRKVNTTLLEVTSEITDLRRLDSQMMTLSRQQFGIEEQLNTLVGVSNKLETRVDKVMTDTQSDMKRVSNLMAAFSANLMKESRASFTEDLKQAARLREEVEEYVKQSQEAIVELDKMVQAAGRHSEAVLQEVRTDLEAVDSRRRKDKSVFEQALEKLTGRLDAAVHSTDATVKGLEHVSGVVSMSLQSERMSVALDLQDFVERKETPYVGIDQRLGLDDAVKRRLTARDSFRKGGLDLAMLTRLQYKPQPLNFAGTSFERPQLLALREKLVHAAQEALLRGPDLTAAARKGINGKLSIGKGAGDGMHAKRLGTNGSLPSGGGSPVPPIVAQVLGATADFSALSGAAGRRSTTPVIARPGSRGQPSARGSPMLEGEMGTPDLARPDYDMPPPHSAGTMGTITTTGKSTAASDGRPFTEMGRSSAEDWRPSTTGTGRTLVSADGHENGGGTNNVPAMLPRLESLDSGGSARGSLASASARG